MVPSWKLEAKNNLKKIKTTQPTLDLSGLEDQFGKEESKESKKERDKNTSSNN